MTAPAITLQEQVDAVREARSRRERAAQFQAGRKGFNPILHARELDRLDAAAATLERLIRSRDEQAGAADA